MKRQVFIQFSIDPIDYDGAEDSPKGVIDLAIAMLERDADLPEEVIISCEGKER